MLCIYIYIKVHRILWPSLSGGPVQWHLLHSLKAGPEQNAQIEVGGCMEDKEIRSQTKKEKNGIVL